MLIKPKQVFIGFAGGLAVFFLAKYLFFADKNVPQDFIDARLESSAIAGEIVRLSKDVIELLDDIAQNDRLGNRAEALALVSSAVVNNQSSQQEALRLSVELEKMARLLPQIEPARARELATAAISSEVALVSRLISYNDLLNQLFELLRSKFVMGYGNSNGKVHVLVEKINAEAQAINDLDRRFNEAIKEFDDI